MATILLVLLQVTVLVALAVAARSRRRIHAQIRALLSLSVTDVAILRRDGVVELCNEGWLVSARSDNPLVCARAGQHWMDTCTDRFATMHPDLPRVGEALARVFRGAEPERVVEYSWVAGSDRRWSTLTLHGIDRGGGAVVAHIDVTARRRSEVAERPTLHDLAHLNIRAAIGELVSVLTHEISQPLTASLANTQALKRILASPPRGCADLEPIVADIGEATNRAAEIVVRVRSVLRKEPGEIRPVKLNALVTDVVGVLKGGARSGGVVLEIDLDPRLPPVSGDVVQLRQVVLNLVTNAVQATQSRTSGPRVVRVATATRGGGACLAVEDGGPGLIGEVSRRLFEPYFTTKEEGLGVGLSISRSIVQAHGGSIDVRNLPEGGARFSVTFPVH